MKLFILFSFILLFSNSRGDYTEDEIKQMWTDTNLNFRVIFLAINTEKCHESKETFTPCMIALNNLLSKIKKDNKDDECYQLRVSNANNKLEIIPFQKKDLPKSKQGNFVFRAELRENYTSFYETNAPIDPESPLYREHESLFKKISELTQKIPEEDKNYLAGETYNIFLRELSDHHNFIRPMALGIPKSVSSYSMGTYTKFHETEDENNGIVIKPVKGSPASSAGLQKGDMILSIDGFDFTDLTDNEQTIDEIEKRLISDQKSQIRLRVQKICDNSDHEEEIIVSRELVSYSSHWFDRKRLVNLDKPEFQECSKSITANSISDGSEALALYLPLKSFEAYLPESHKDTSYQLCNEFLHLQGLDLQNPQSQGIILDLRGNEGGKNKEASCMLNTIIESDELILQLLPINYGSEDTPTPDEIEVSSLYFAEGGFARPDMFYPTIYNKNIVVLVDEKSASASEVFAGTIQSMKRGWVVGERTFGKGTGQSREFQKISKEVSGETSEPKPIEMVFTMGVYTLNSGHSPQGHGIIPDFHVSKTGEFIEPDPNYISPENQLAFDMLVPPIPFKNDPWEQNRPNELIQLKECVHKKGRMGELLKQKIREDKRYARPFVADYQLELAKDILKCSPKREPFLLQNYFSEPFLEKYEKIK